MNATGTDSRVRALLWVDGPSESLVASVAAAMDEVEVIGVGAENRAAALQAAESLGAEPAHDPRIRINESRPDWLVIGSTDGLHRDALEHARRVGCRVIAIEPLGDPAGGEAAAAESEGEAEGARAVSQPLIHFAPRLRMSEPWLGAADELESLDDVRAAQVVAVSPQHATSLFARLVDALDVLVSVMGMPDTIDASLTGALAEPPEALRGLTGHVTAHLRFADGASAVLLASDRAAAWSRGVRLVAHDAEVVLDDRACGVLRIAAPDGDAPDAGVSGASKPAGKKRSRRKKIDPPGGGPVEAIVAQWRRLMREDAPAASAVDWPTVLACCQATLLSCRTASPESPGTLLQITGG